MSTSRGLSMGAFDRYYWLYEARRKPRLKGNCAIHVSQRMKPPTPIEPCYLWGMHFLRTNWGVIIEGNEFPQFMRVYYKRKKDKRITNEDCLEHFKGLPRWPAKQE